MGGEGFTSQEEAQAAAESLIARINETQAKLQEAAQNNPEVVPQLQAELESLMKQARGMGLVK